ncbi:MAG: hypothetical protein NVS1B13_03830 [Flavisolibacter sp.]
MEEKIENFELDYQNKKIRVQRRNLGYQVIFRVQFGPNGTPLILTRAASAPGQRFWTSIPEGRQKEAEQIGPLIEQYFRVRS